jgi:phage tail-like protein
MPTVVQDSRSRSATDPLRNFRFQININHTTPQGDRLVQLGFSTLDGINLEIQPLAYREGGFNTTPQKMPGQADYSPLTLTRGQTLNVPHVWNWITEIQAVIQGTGQMISGSNFRSDVDIFVLEHPYTRDRTRVPIKVRYKVYNAWPSSMSVSGLDAGGNAVNMEQIILQHEGWVPSYADKGAYDAPAIRLG